MHYIWLKPWEGIHYSITLKYVVNMIPKIKKPK